MESLRAGFQFQDYLVYPTRNLIKGHNGEQTIEPKAMRVLLFLAQNQNEVVTRQALLDEVWAETYSGDEALTRCISLLRTALGGKKNDIIQTIPKQGYRFVAPVSPLSSCQNTKSSVSIAPQSLSKQSPSKTKNVMIGSLSIALIMVILGGIINALGFFQYVKTPETNEVHLVSDSLDNAKLTSSIQQSNEPSIAVMPFINLSGDKNNDYFSEGIAEEILNVLARTPELKVTSRSSSFSFKGKSVLLSEIGKTLGVEHILEGSVRKMSNRLRISVQLIDVKTDTHLWNHTYDRNITDIFAIQDDITAEIIGALRENLGLPVEMPHPMLTVSTRNLEAYDLFLKGRWAFYERGKELDSSITWLSQAVKLDPTFAEAWTYLAGAASVVYGYNTQISSPDAMVIAKHSISVALELNPNSAQAMAVQGWIHRYDGDWMSAFEIFKKAIALNPKNSSAQLWLAGIYLQFGQLNKATEHFEAAYHLEPLTGINNGYLGLVYAMRGQHTLAKERIYKGLELNWYTSYLHIIPELIHFAQFNELNQLHQKYDLEYQDLIYFLITSESPDKMTAALNMFHQLKPNSNAGEYLKFGFKEAFFEQLSLDLTKQEKPLVMWEAMAGLWFQHNKHIIEDPRLITMMKQSGTFQFWTLYGFPDACTYVTGEADHLECHW